MGLEWWEQEEFVAADVLELTDEEKQELGNSLVAFLEVVGARRIIHCLEVSIGDLADCLLFIEQDDEMRESLTAEHNILSSVLQKVLDSIERKRVE